VSEIFYSIQGEGIYQFSPQVFVRFRDCNLRCLFCDTKPLVYREMSLEEVLKNIYSFEGFWDSVALTGGEPLLQVGFLRDLCRQLKKGNQRMYLETNATLYKELEQIIEFLDIISLDFKLPSSTGLADFWDTHNKFLRIASSKNAFVKAVITSSTTKEDIIKSAAIIREIDPGIFFVLQPVFSYEIPLWSKLEEYRSLALEYIPNVRIIPQLHKHIGVK